MLSSISTLQYKEDVRSSCSCQEVTASSIDRRREVLATVWSCGDCQILFFYQNIPVQFFEFPMSLRWWRNNFFRNDFLENEVRLLNGVRVRVRVRVSIFSYLLSHLKKTTF